ncbi:MAG: DUF2934 domain-containing protein [Deltaproteobacteria bacterium]|nr:DUF2934 domain-containing protein [Deltaproteobacteria bacterium]MBW1896924.1 DUF2934 domain-containing protein [Deltaproteobacteria bacterium]
MTKNKRQNNSAANKTEKKTSRNLKPKKEKQFDLQSFQAEVNKRAYDIFLQRGYVHGNDLSDWLKAEKEIKQEQEIE